MSYGEPDNNVPDGVIPAAGDYQVYNPYGGFQGQDLGSYNAAGPNLGQSEYLYESSATKMRTIPERMTFGAGTAYLVGNGSGVLWGAYEGYTQSKKRNMSNVKFIRTNILNGMGKRGQSLGNQAGVIGMTFGVVNGCFAKLRARDDALNAVGAGFVTGAIHQAVGGTALKAARGSVVGGSIAIVASVALALFDGENPVEKLESAINSFA